VAYLSLAHEAVLMLMQIFYRVLKGYDVAVLRIVHAVYHTAERRRFSAAGLTCNQYKPGFAVAQAENFFRDRQIFGPWQLKRDKAEHRRERVALFIYVASEASRSGDRKRKIIVAVHIQSVHVALCNGKNIGYYPARIVGHEYIFAYMLKFSSGFDRNFASGYYKNIRSVIIDTFSQ